MDAKKILILEDELITATEMAETLAAEGYEIIGPAINFGAALQLLNSGNPDLLLIDIQLKNDTADGIQFAQIVRKQSTAPIIFITANSQKETLAQIAEISNTDYIQKVIRMEYLISKVFLAFNNIKSEKRISTQHDFVMLFIGNSLKKVNVSDVVLLMAGRTNTTIYLKSNYSQNVVTKYLGKISEQFPFTNFVKIGRSLIINTDYILEVTNTSLIMDFPRFEHYFKDGQRKQLLEILKNK